MATPKKKKPTTAAVKPTKPLRKKSAPVDTSPSKKLAEQMAQAAHDLKAVDLTVLDMRKLGAFTDFFIIASGTSDRHVQAISENIRSSLAKAKESPIGIEGYQKGHWVLLDYGNVVAHLFYEEAREFYGLEKFWSDAPRVKFKLK